MTVEIDLDIAIAIIEARFQRNRDQPLEPDLATFEPIPYFILIRTELGCIWRFRKDLPHAAIRDLAKLAGREPPIKRPIDEAPPAERQTPMLRVLEALGYPTEPIRNLIYKNPAALPIATSTTRLLEQVESEAELDSFAEAEKRVQFVCLPWPLGERISLSSLPDWRPVADLLFFRAPLGASKLGVRSL